MLEHFSLIDVTIGLVQDIRTVPVVEKAIVRSSNRLHRAPELVLLIPHLLEQSSRSDRHLVILTGPDLLLLLLATMHLGAG